MCEARAAFYCYATIENPCGFNTDEGRDPERCDHLCGFNCISDEARAEAYKELLKKVTKDEG